MAQIAAILNEMSEDINEIDIVMSQVNIEGDDARGGYGDKNWSEGIDEVDFIMSQMADEGDAAYQVDLKKGNDNGSMDCEPEIPPHLLAEYEKAICEILPRKSARRYLNAYDIFVKWQEANKSTTFSEKEMMAYFREAGGKYKPSTVWSMYSMLKNTLILKQNIDISRYSQLVAWIKRNSDGYECTQSNVFTPEEINQFVVEAPDVVYLAMKVVLGFGVIGLCRGDELTNMKLSDVKDTGEYFVVKIPHTKTKTPKVNVVDGEYTHIIRKYVSLRPTDATSDRFFMQYRNGRCVNQVIGKNSIAKFPKEIAKFLQLENPESYTGHSYRRTGATIAADAGAKIEEMKRMGPWISTKVCEKYIQESVGYKRKLGRIISGAINLPSTVTSCTNNAQVSGAKHSALCNGTISPMMDDNAACASGTTSGSKFCGLASAMSSVHEIERVISKAINLPTTATAGSSDEMTCDGSRVLSQSTNSVNSIGINVPATKGNVVLHFGGNCSNFTIINMK